MKVFLYFFLFFNLIFKIAYTSEIELKIALASNFLGTFKNFVYEFEKKNNCRIILISDSSSNLYSKVLNGANFDVFITADKRHFLLLSNVCEKFYLPLTFVGRLSLFIKKKKIKKNLMINLNAYKKLCLANKDLAPYGYASFELLKNLKIVYNDFVFGQNVNQTFVFINSLNSDLGFVSLSQNMSFNTDLDFYYKIPKYMHSYIKQDIIFLSSNPILKIMEDFIKSFYFIEVIIANGYDILK